MKQLLFILLICSAFSSSAQINTEHFIDNGRSKLYFGNYVGAIENFNLVISLKSHLPEPYFFRGVAKLNLEDFRGAEADINKALEIKPFYPLAYMYSGVVNYHLGDYQKAMEFYSKSLEMDPENADIYNNRGICKMAMKDIDGGIDDFTKAITYNKKSYNAYLNRSYAYQVKKDINNALSDCDNAIRIRPHSSEAYINRGIIKLDKKDYAGALMDFDMAIRFDPNNAFAYNNRGLTKSRLEDHESALLDFEKAVRLNPQMASAYFNRGISKEILGDFSFHEDYQIASSLDSRFSVRPWEQQQQQQQQQQQGNQQAITTQKNNGNQNIANTDTINSTNDNDQKIDYESLRKRRIKANLVVADNRKKPGETVDDGRVQNQNIDIELKTNFEMACFTENIVKTMNAGYFNLNVDRLNKTNNYRPYLTITGYQYNLADEQEYFENQILSFTERIAQTNQISNNYLIRGIFYNLLGKYQEALHDLNEAIRIDDKNILAYFTRANVRINMLKLIEDLQDFSSEMLISDESGLYNQDIRNRPHINYQDYNDITTDLEVVSYLDPNFYFVYFNLGNLYCKQEKFELAMKQYDRAIEIAPEFAEAYYNRGLVKVFLNRIDEGAIDLSKAGELGIQEAYNVIKRYCN